MLSFERGFAERQARRRAAGFEPVGKSAQLVRALLGVILMACSRESRQGFCTLTDTLFDVGLIPQAVRLTAARRMIFNTHY